VFNLCRKEVVLSKTPAATRRRKPALAKHSRTLRSTSAHRGSVDSGESLDSGVEVEMTKKSRCQLDIVTEKADEEQTVTSVKAVKRDSQPASRKALDESRRKTEENKENIGTNVIVKQTDSDKECDKNQQQTVTQQTSQTSNSCSFPASNTNSQVLVSLSTVYSLLYFMCYV